MLTVGPHLHNVVQAPISAFGDYRVPLDLDDAGGKQVELTLSVIKTRTMQN